MSITLEELKSDLSKVLVLYSAYTDKVKDFIAVHNQTSEVLKEPINGTQLVELCNFYGADKTTLKELRMKRTMAPSMHNNDLLYWNLDVLYIPGAGSSIEIFAQADLILGNLNSIIRTFTKMCYEALDQKHSSEDVLKAMYIRRDINRLRRLLTETSGYGFSEELIKWSEVPAEDNYIETDYDYSFLEDSEINNNFVSKRGSNRLSYLNEHLGRTLFAMRCRIEFITRLESFKILLLTN